MTAGNYCISMNSYCYNCLVSQKWGALLRCFAQVIPKCVARVPVSLGGLGVRLCVRQKLRLRPQPSATVRNRLR